MGIDRPHPQAAGGFTMTPAIQGRSELAERVARMSEARCGVRAQGPGCCFACPAYACC